MSSHRTAHLELHNTVRQPHRCDQHTHTHAHTLVSGVSCQVLTQADKHSSVSSQSTGLRVSDCLTAVETERPLWSQRNTHRNEQSEGAADAVVSRRGVFIL